MELSEQHRHFLRVEQGVVPMGINFVLNGGIAWLLFRSAEHVPLWGESSLGVDLLVTAFLLPFFTCLIVSRIVGGQVASGKLLPLASAQLPLSRWFRRPPWARAVLLGGLGVALAAAPLVWALDLGRAQPLGVYPFATFKAVWAALLAGVVSPFVGWWALASASLVDAK